MQFKKIYSERVVINKGMLGTVIPDSDPESTKEKLVCRKAGLGGKSLLTGMAARYPYKIHFFLNAFQVMFYANQN